MKFENPVINDEMAAEIDEAVARAEAATTPSRMASLPISRLPMRLRNCVQKFPMSAVLTAFAGGLLMGAAFGWRNSLSWEKRYIAKPVRDQVDALPSLLGSAAGMLERIFSKRMDDLEDFARSARKLTRKVKF